MKIYATWVWPSTSVYVWCKIGKMGCIEKTMSKNSQERAKTGRNEWKRAGTSKNGRNKQKLAGMSENGQERAETGRNEQKRAGTSKNGQERAKTGRNGQKQAGMIKNRQERARTDRNRLNGQERIKMENVLKFCCILVNIWFGSTRQNMLPKIAFYLSGRKAHAFHGELDISSKWKIRSTRQNMLGKNNGREVYAMHGCPLERLDIWQVSD